MAKRFERALDSATEQTLVEPNWEGILECVDMIRGADVPVGDAVPLIQKRYHSTNPHVAHHALLVLEACVKNCGKKFHVEIATKEFMDDLKNLVIGGTADKVKEKILELVQCWSSAFRDKPEYKIVVDTHNLLKMNGFEFPVMKEADAMFMADSAPDWVEGDNCYRCRTEFGVFTRRHHCRACGQIFCDKCSNKQMLLPQFGIEKRVRVCESCFDKKTKQKALAAVNNEESKQPGDSSNDEARERARLQELMDKEAEELQLALAISQSEAEAKEKERQTRGGYPSYSNSISTSNSCAQNVNGDSETILQKSEIYKGAASNIEEVSATKMDNDEPPMDSVLAKYLDRDYWERKRLASKEPENAVNKATAPPPSEISMSISSNDPQNGYFDSASVAATPRENDLNGGALAASFDKLQLNKQQTIIGDDVTETSQFCKTLKEQVDTMDNRMRSNLQRGRSIINDSAIHSLSAQLTNSHANVLDRMTKLEREREYYETLQDHLAHIQEARQAVNALREEHMRQKEARLMEEQHQRRIQMQQKLEFMRQKKHEMLLHQRHLALQRFHEQEQRRLIFQQPQQSIAQQTVAGATVPPGFYPQQGGLPVGHLPSGSPATVGGGAQPQHQFYQHPLAPPSSSVGQMQYGSVSSAQYAATPPVSHQQPYYAASSQPEAPQQYNATGAGVQPQQMYGAAPTSQAHHYNASQGGENGNLNALQQSYLYTTSPMMFAGGVIASQQPTTLQYDNSGQYQHQQYQPQYYPPPLQHEHQPAPPTQHHPDYAAQQHGAQHVQQNQHSQATQPPPVNNVPEDLLISFD